MKQGSIPVGCILPPSGGKGRRLVVLLKSSPSRGWVVLLGSGGPPRGCSSERDCSPSRGSPSGRGIVNLGGGGLVVLPGGSPSRGGSPCWVCSPSG